MDCFRSIRIMSHNWFNEILNSFIRIGEEESLMVSLKV